VTWTNTCGPLFGNTIATLQVDGRRAEVYFEQPRGQTELEEVGRVTLSRADTDQMEADEPVSRSAG
jgi:hypothetical protein